VFHDGEITETYETLVDPDDYFDPFNVSIHNIDEARVLGAPRFDAIYPELGKRVSGSVVVCHTFFDRAAMHQACTKYRLADVGCRWLDTTRVVRRAGSQYARSGYGLANLTREFGMTFNHHDAAEDARATGMILVKAMRETGLSLEDWITRSNQPLTLRDKTIRAKTTREGGPTGPLAGEVAVFTGALSIPRNKAADLAADAGCEVDSGVTKDTTLLIVGDQVARLAPGQSKSTKHIKAEALIARGQAIRILQESNFLRLTGSCIS